MDNHTKKFIAAIVAYICVWVCSSSVICVAIHYTHSAKYLWFLMIPALLTISTSDSEDKP